MVRWGLNGRPVNDDNNFTNHVRPKFPKNPKKSNKKESHIEIINNKELIDKNMEINILGRLLDKNNRPITNAEIEVIDNNTFLKTLTTSSQGYFMFYGGYIGLYHSFIFKFKGNKKFNSCDYSLIFA